MHTLCLFLLFGMVCKASRAQLNRATSKCCREMSRGIKTFLSPLTLLRFAAAKLCMCRDERGDQLANRVERVNICRLIPQHCSLVEFNFTNATLLSVFISHTRAANSVKFSSHDLFFFFDLKKLFFAHLLDFPRLF